LTVVMILLALAFALDAVRMRGRLAALAVLDDDADHGPAGDHLFVVAPGVDLDESTRRAASAFAKARELDVVDLVPRDLRALRALQLARVADPKTYRADRIARGRTAGHALLVSASLAARLDLKDPRDAVQLAELAKRAKLYAPGRADVAIAPDERASKLDLD